MEHVLHFPVTPPPEEEYADIQLQPAAAGDGSAGTQPPYNPHYNDPSMTLPPFSEWMLCVCVCVCVVCVRVCLRACVCACATLSCHI